MPAMTRCPNVSCGRISQLVDDPLGRIFRCPRCLTKLPTASAAAADAGWTAVGRPLTRAGAGEGSSGFEDAVSLARSAARGHAAAGRGSVPSRERTGGVAVATGDPADRDFHPEFESGDVFVGGLGWGIHGGGSGSASGSGPGVESSTSCGLWDSGEVYVEPMSQPGTRVSAWSMASQSIGGAASTSPALSPSRSVEAVSAVSSPSRGGIGSGEGEQLGRFRIIEVLGQGQHATVYRAWDAMLEREVALKVPRPGVLRSERSLERFLGEARAQARLRHSRIVPVYEAGRAGDRHYIAMALIEGQSLADRLADDGAMAPARAAHVAAELAEALAYAHAQGVVHRDVKPANVRIDGEGAVYLMDFGIAYRPDSNELPLPPGTILGTPAYVAPEQAESGRRDPLPASDQYSLGTVFYELLCGRPPFVGPASYVLFQAIHHPVPSPRTVEPKVPRALAAICLKAMARDPERRYADCQAFADDLRRWLLGENPQARRKGWARLGR